MQSILIASDLSARCDRAYDRALQIAQELDVPLILLHVVAPKRDDASINVLRESVVGDLVGPNGHVEVDIRRGSVPSTIAAVAAQRDCALIVTGVAQFNSPWDYLLGTAVNYVVRHASVPVLVVKRKPHRPYRRLLVATDFSSCSAKALQAAAALFPDASLKLVNVCHSSFETWLDPDETARHNAEEAEMRMTEMLGTIPEAVRARIDREVRRGELANALNQMSREEGHDLIVFGSHGLGSIAQATIGSRAADLLIAAEPDTLIVHAWHGSDAARQEAAAG